MRVLHVINGLGTGGAERSLVEMLPGLVERGLEPEIAILNRRGEGVEELVADGDIRLHDLSGRPRTAQLLHLARVVRERRPDVVHTTIFESDVMGRLAASTGRCPAVSSLVNTSYGSARSGDANVSRWKLGAVRALDGWTARHLSRGFHAITHAVADDAVRQLRIDPAAVTVIPRGRSRSRLGEPSAARRGAARAELGLAEEDFVVVNVGRQEFQKGQSTLLQAAARLRDTPAAPVVLIAGRVGNETGRLQRLHAELSLGDSVRFLGHVDNVPDLLSAADAFAFPSRFEGLGGSVLEALALEVPVVAADVPALREVLRGGELGPLVPVGDDVALADALSEMRSDPATALQRAAAGRRVFESDYRLEHVVDEMATWLRDRAPGAHRRPSHHRAERSRT